jgi:hypothetical protein
MAGLFIGLGIGLAVAPSLKNQLNLLYMGSAIMITVPALIGFCIIQDHPAGFGGDENDDKDLWTLVGEFWANIKRCFRVGPFQVLCLGLCLAVGPCLAVIILIDSTTPPGEWIHTLIQICSLDITFILWDSLACPVD